MKSSFKSFSRGLLLAAAVLAASAAHAQFWSNGGNGTSSYGQSDIPSSQARGLMNVQTGKVVDIQDTKIEVQASGSSQAFGGVVGGLVGALLGSKESSSIGTSLVAAAGAYGGSEIAKRMSQEMRPAQQVTVQLKNGNVVALVQEPNGTPLGVGDSVALVGSYPAVRAVKATWAN